MPLNGCQRVSTGDNCPLDTHPRPLPTPTWNHKVKLTRLGSDPFRYCLERVREKDLIGRGRIALRLHWTVPVTCQINSVFSSDEGTKMDPIVANTNTAFCFDGWDFFVAYERGEAITLLVATKVGR